MALFLNIIFTFFARYFWYIIVRVGGVKDTFCPISLIKLEENPNISRQSLPLLSESFGITTTFRKMKIFLFDDYEVKEVFFRANLVIRLWTS